MKGVETSEERIGRYRLLEKIGEGGMGVVHMAADPAGRTVAIKILRSSVAADRTALRRLAREVDTMRRVHDPHVAEIIDADVTAEPPYVVTQYVPGNTLEDTVRDYGPLHGQALKRLATGLADALAAIHGAGVIHRDLKPGNVMFLDNGEPVVIDFGIAQGVDATRLTATGMVIGTPGYLAPELIDGEDAGAPSDVHSWASTVAFAATGRAPFGSGTFESIFYKIMEGKPDLDGVPEPLLPLIRAAMARNPAERPTAVGLAGLAARIDLEATRVDAPSGTRPLTTVADQPRQVPPATPKDFKGLIPPVAGHPSPQPQQPQPPPQSYPPYGYPAHPSEQMRRPPYGPGAPEPEADKPHGIYRVLGFLLLVGALGLTAILPSIALVLVLVVLLGLRVVDRAQHSLTSRRTRRGPRAGDVAAVIAKSPFAAVRCALSMLIVAPLGIGIAFVVMLVAMAVEPGWTVSRIISAAVAVFLVAQCLGPGSVGARRQLARVWGVVVPRRDKAMIVAGSLALVVFFLVTFALTQVPDLRPFDFDWLTSGVGDLRGWIRDVVGG